MPSESAGGRNACDLSHLVLRVNLIDLGVLKLQIGRGRGISLLLCILCPITITTQ